MSRFNWHGVVTRISTILGIVSASAASGLAAYAIMPHRVQDLFPEWGMIAMGVAAVGSALLVPVATSFKQKSKEVKQ